MRALALLVFVPAVALAEPGAADLASARTLGVEGLKLADDGNCKEAADKLKRAEGIYHAPTTLGRLGECQIQLGQIVEGLENLRRVMRENVAGNEAFTKAQERARGVFDKNHERPGKLTIAVKGPTEGIVVTLDGVALPGAVLGNARHSDPGEHVVEASAPGWKKASQTVKISEKGSESVTLTLEIDPTAPKPTTPSTQPLPIGSNPPPKDVEAKSNYVPAFIAGGIGIAGLAVGGIFGGLALGSKSTLDGQCTAKNCPESARSAYDSAKTQSAVSTVGFIVGGIGAAASIAFFVFAPKSASSAEVHAIVGPSSIGVAGKF